MLLGRGQNAFESDDNQIIDQVSVNVLGPSAHVFLFEVAHPPRNGAFDFALRFHRDPSR
jgi:hypothetical protein